MEVYIITKAILTGIADAIRAKCKTTDTFTPEEMIQAIENMLSSSPMPNSVETEEDMDYRLETSEIGSVYKYTGETCAKYIKNSLYIVSNEVSGNV